MKLRSTIRAPARYGESNETETPTSVLLQSMRRTRAQSHSASPNPYGLNENDSIQAHVVEFDPRLPPAAFPTLEQPCPVRTNLLHGILRNGKDDLDPYQTVRRIDKFHLMPDLKTSNGRDCALGDIPLHSIENYVASNTELNPIYVNNMARMASQSNMHMPYSAEFEDSDLEEPKDASEILGEKVCSTPPFN